MPESALPHELIAVALDRSSGAPSLTTGTESWTYAELPVVFAGSPPDSSASASRGDRVAIFLEKRFETVVASFGAAAAGCLFVPLNPVLKAEQVVFIMRDCDARVLVTSSTG